MKKNVASQLVGIQLVSATDGSAVASGTTTCYVTGDGGAQAAGSVSSGAATHKGNGYWEYAPAQAETNYDHVAFTFVNTSAVPATVQIWTSFPQTGDAFARIGAPAGASVSADIASVKTDTTPIRTGTAQAGAANTITLDVGASATDDIYDASWIRLTGGTGAGQVRRIISYVGSTKVATINSGVLGLGWVTSPDNTTSFAIVPAASISAVNTIYGVTTGAITSNSFAAGAINAAAIAADAITDAKVAADVTIASVTGAVGSVTGAVGSVTGNVGGNVVGTVASVVGAVGSVTGNVGGNVTGSVGSVAAGGIAAASFAAGAIDNAAIAADAIGSSELAASAASEIATAVRTELTTELGRVDVAVSTRLATSGYTAPLDAAGTRTAVGLASANLDTQLAALDADVLTRLATSGYTAPLSAAGTRTAVGLASANLDTQLGAIAGYIDTEVAAIKAKTDNLPSDPADASDIAGAFSTVNATLATIAGYIDTEVAAIKAKTDNLPASPAATSDIPTAAAVADAVWDEAIAGHAIAGSTGEALSNAGAAGTPPTVGAIADEVQTRTIAAVTVVNGLAANSVTAAALAADAGTEIGTAVWASGTRTLSSFGTLVADIATAVWGATTRLLTAGTNIVLAKGTGVTGFNDLSAAQVNTEADTALADAGVTTVRMAHLDADVSSRLATAGYTVPPTAAANATAVRTELTTELARIDVATSTRLATGSYTAPDNAGIAVAEAAAASAATNATTLVGRLTSTRAGLLDNLDAAISTRAIAGDAMALTAGERGSVADKLLGRSLAGGADGGRTVQDALRALRNKTSIVGGVLTVTQEDDATEAWNAAVTTAPGDPLTAIDPA